MYFCYWSPLLLTSPEAMSHHRGGGLIVPRGNPVPAAPNSTEATVWARGPHWYEAQRLNGVLKVYGGFLLGRRSLGVYRATSNVNGSLAAPQRVDDVGLRTHGKVNQGDAPGQGGCAVGGLGTTDVRVGLDVPSEWLLGQFSLLGEPRWGPPAAAAARGRARVPRSHGVAVMLQNQDENRNVWSTLQWSAAVNGASVLELDPADGRLKPLLDDSPWLPGLQLAIDAGGARVFVLERAK